MSQPLNGVVDACWMHIGNVWINGWLCGLHLRFGLVLPHDKAARRLTHVILQTSLCFVCDKT